MDPIANMLAIITNAQAIGQTHVEIPFSKVKLQIANLLNTTGYLGGVEKKKRKQKKGSEIEYIDLSLKYDTGIGLPGQGAISGIRLISKPSRHIYIKAHDIKPVRSGYGTAVLSTSQGIMTSQEAKKTGLGGEVLFEIW